MSRFRAQGDGDRRKICSSNVPIIRRWVISALCFQNVLRVVMIVDICKSSRQHWYTPITGAKFAEEILNSDIKMC